jgi:hypothetical protein
MVGNIYDLNPPPGTARLYRDHSETCPFRDRGVRHVDCNCPIFIDCRQNGKRAQRSLRTRNWSHAKELLKAIEKGTPVDAVAGIHSLRLIRRHVKACPLRTLGRGHNNCNCPIYIDGYKDAEGKLIRRIDLRTREWPHAQERLAAIERGRAVIEAVAEMPRLRLYRQHEKVCPFCVRGRGRTPGRGHIDCNCPIYIDYGRKDGKNIRRSLRTREWPHAQERLAAIERAAAPSMSVGARLRAGRAEAGLSRNDVEKALKGLGVDISADAVKKHERDENEPRPKVKRAYATLYKKALIDLFPA